MLNRAIVQIIIAQSSLACVRSTRPSSLMTPGGATMRFPFHDTRTPSAARASYSGRPWTQRSFKLCAWPLYHHLC